MSTPNRHEETNGQEAAASVFQMRFEIGDILIGLAMVGTAAWFWIKGADIPDYSGMAVGPDDFPRGLAVLLAAFSAVLVIGAGRRLATRMPSGRRIVVERPIHVLLGMALLLLFPPLMEAVGYYLAMGLWLAVFLWLADCRRPLHILIYVASFLAFTKLVFEMLLGTPIP